MIQLLLRAIQLAQANEEGNIPEHHYYTQVQQIKNELDILCEQNLSEAYPQANEARQQLADHREKLLVFLDDEDVPATNNKCEQKIRQEVVHEKMIGSFRSEEGAREYADYMTVTETAKERGKNIWNRLTELVEGILPIQTSISYLPRAP